MPASVSVRPPAQSDHPSQMTIPTPSDSLRAPTPSRPITLTISTSRGQAHGLWRPSRTNRAALLMLPGSDGALSGPSGLYTDLAGLMQHNAAIAQLSDRHTGSLEERRDDVLSALDALSRQGVERVALIGWDTSAVVALSAGARSRLVTGVACLAPDIQLDEHTRADLAMLSPRRLFLAHGAADSVVPQSVSILTGLLAGPTTELALYPEATHDFSYARAELLKRLTQWTAALLRTPFRPAFVASR